MIDHIVYLIRHGESAANVDHKVYFDLPDHDIPLSNKGIEQCAELGKHLHTELEWEGKEGAKRVNLITSPYLRARQTAHLMLSHAYNPDRPDYKPGTDVLLGKDIRFMLSGGQLHICPELREHEWASGIPCPEEDAKHNWKMLAQHGPMFMRFRNGECGSDVRDRLSLWNLRFQDFLRVHPGPTLIVSHGWAITHLKAILETPIGGFPLYQENPYATNIGNARYFKLDLSPDH